MIFFFNDNFVQIVEQIFRASKIKGRFHWHMSTTKYEWVKYNPSICLVLYLIFNGQHNIFRGTKNE